MSVRIEEFPHICPHVVRSLVIKAAWEANILAQKGENVVGVGIKQKGGYLCSSTAILKLGS